MLPDNPSLQHYKKQAGKLLKAALRGEPKSVKRFNSYPNLLIKHSHALFIIARENGFRKWEDLRAEVLKRNRKHGHD